MNTMSMEQPHFTITGRKVLFAMLAFFGVIFTVNGVFLYFALNTWPGLTSDKAYVEGLDYNQVLEAAERQNVVGWQSAVTITPNESGSLVTLTLLDAAGDALTKQGPILNITRPVGQPEPIAIAAHETSPGVYESRMPTLEAGRWHVIVQVGTDYRLDHEVWIKP